MCTKFQVAANVARMETQQCTLIFSCNKCPVHQRSDSYNYMADEDLETVSEVRHANNPVILIFQMWQVLYCSAAESGIICSIRITTVLHTEVTLSNQMRSLSEIFKLLPLLTFIL